MESETSTLNWSKRALVAVFTGAMGFVMGLFLIGVVINAPEQWTVVGLMVITSLAAALGAWAAPRRLPADIAYGDLIQRLGLSLLMVFALAVFLFAPVMPLWLPASQYRAVHDASIMRTHRELGVDYREEFAVADEALFLKVKTTTRTVLLVEQVEPEVWTSERLAAFRKKHPELEAYWPNAAAPDGGVEWVQRR